MYNIYSETYSMMWNQAHVQQIYVEPFLCYERYSYCTVDKKWRDWLIETHRKYLIHTNVFCFVQHMLLYDF